MDLSCNLLINGVAQNSSITNKIMFFMVSDNEGLELNNLILTLNNADNSIIPPNTKANVELVIGFGNPVSTGKFIVQFVEYNEGTITLKGVSQDLALARVKQNRVFENQTLSSILNTMANNLGLKYIFASREEFERFNNINPKYLTDIERAVRFFYLQRLGFGGKIHNRCFAVKRGTQSRDYNRLYANASTFNLERLMPKLDKVAERLYRVILENMDFEQFIKKYDSAWVLFYLDPP